jgi:hypothetical protein
MSVFDNAVRYHSGGIAGIRPDEVPTILQRGEEVLTASDPRHRNNGGGGSMVVEVIDQRGSDAPEIEQQTSSENGIQRLRLFIKETVKGELSGGSMDGVMSQFGAYRSGGIR